MKAKILPASLKAARDRFASVATFDGEYSGTLSGHIFSFAARSLSGCTLELDTARRGEAVLGILNINPDGSCLFTATPED